MGNMIKDLIESTDLISVPGKQSIAEDLTMSVEEAVDQVTLPVSDFSLLTSGSPKRSKIIEELQNACLHWEFFMQKIKRNNEKTAQSNYGGTRIREEDIEKSLELNSVVQKFSANIYPPCPQPDLAVDLLPHADRGLSTLLIQNDVGGLQIKNMGK
ncbi:DIBOA-glucoside dioxygenase BX6-like [Papaver somniferum]|uniref:DIBOA-glucoside dioxygenase BX6-like n=1 Tax=Papaver somniferum TaxID=3469 RepID=UPI000E6F608D|nr:DIBOA-glucoside dioxygenase BX6-like [Papaver somniferum]